MKHLVDFAGIEGVTNVLPQKFESRLVRQVRDILEAPGSRLSAQTTEWPSASTASHECEPKNPAPPVTKTRMLRPYISSPREKITPGPKVTGVSHITSLGLIRFV